MARNISKNNRSQAGKSALELRLFFCGEQLNEMFPRKFLSN